MPGVTLERSTRREVPLPDRALPVGVADRRIDLADAGIDHAVQELFLVGHMRVERHRRLCQINRNRFAPYGISRGRVHTRPLTEMENTPQPGHADAHSSAVTTCTTRPSNASDSTRSTARPSKSSRREASETESFRAW